MERLQLSWAVDFLDSPFEGADFKFWGGNGDLVLGEGDNEITYRGTNGVISIQPPREKSSEAVKMTIEMDASNPDVREQLRHDIGPLRIRIRWIWYRPSQGGDGNDGITPLINRATWWGPGTDLMNYPQADNNLTTHNEVFPVRFRSVGEEQNFQVGVTYWARNFIIYTSQGWATLSFYDTEANATNAQGLRQFLTNQPGRIHFTTNDGAGVVVGKFDEDEFVPASGPGGWEETGKEFVGRLSSPVLSGAKYYVDVESQISDIQRGRVLSWSNDTQLARFPSDKGMEYLAEYAEGVNTKWPP